MLSGRKMKERYVKRKTELDIDFLLQKGFSPQIAEVVAARGVTEQNYDQFFGNKMILHSPFEMKNMLQATELIRMAMENDGSVLICGDYDADGLSSSAILSLFFSENGIANDVLIPTRDEGYGLHADSVIKAFENNYYDLVITVDCGISNADEVKKIQDELGVEVIVTDHHELPEVLPDCICVNPKLGYPFAYLSGSGVAWKLVEALAGRDEALKYVDLAGIGTVGDIMPMQDENRSIVKLALANWNHKGLQKLAELSKCGKELTCSDVAMKIVPKINAAGRVGNPQAALKVLLQKSKSDASSVNTLLELNEQRKQILDEIVAQADSMCDDEVIAAERMVFLAGESWQHGVLGIAAARYKEKYYVPSLVMTRDGENYVGSARSVDDVDLFEAFCACKGYLEKFGGHKASVGFTVSANKLNGFRKAISKQFCLLDDKVFQKVSVYDAEITPECNAQELFAVSKALQPLLPSEKLICRVRGGVQFANAFGKDNQHLSFTMANGLELKGFFKYGKYAPFIKNGANIDAVCSLDKDSYTGNVCGIVDDMTLTNSVCFDELYRLNLYKNFLPQSDVFRTPDVASLLAEKSVLVVFDDYETFLSYAEKYDFSDFSVDIFFDGNENGKTVVVSPLSDYPFEKYRNVVAFQTEFCRVLPERAVIVKVAPSRQSLYEPQLDRNVCALAFAALKKKGQYDSLKGVYDKYLTGKITYGQYVLSLRVFEQLGLVKIPDKYTVEIDSTVRNSLENSSIYRCFAK